MVKIEFAHFRYRYRYLWLKYVTGTNLSVHCARCLIGEYDSRIHHGVIDVENVELPKSPYYYLCGVTSKWENNLHLAFREKEGAVIEIDNNQIRCRIINAEQLPISSEYIDPTLAHADKKAYNTCRNWWFANYISSHGNRIEFNKQEK